MRVLLYNFIQPDDPGKQKAGGVGIYQRNLINSLLSQGHDVVSLSAGDKDDLFSNVPRIEVKVARYVKAWIINSPIWAPAHESFHRINEYYESEQLDALPAKFADHFGTIDVFHFQNVEGLTSGFFRKLREAYPIAKIILSAHNYNLVCPQVNLWHREFETCVDYRDGRACVNCLVVKPRTDVASRRRYERALELMHVKSNSLIERQIRRAIRYALRLGRFGKSIRDVTPKKSLPLNIMDQKSSSRYQRYRQENIALSTNIFDHILAVSKRTQSVLISKGVPEQKLAVSYIGTAHSENFDQSKFPLVKDDGLHLGFLGYMRADKGFYFFIDTLFSIPEDIARHISVTIAAPMNDHGALERLKGVAHRFQQIRVFNGYSHKDLDAILSSVNLGVIPVLWEDNLPQVAIEMVTRGVPVLCSDRGGAQEIANNSTFVFRSGSKSDFCSKIAQFVAEPELLRTFWYKPLKIVSMRDHIDDLMTYYTG